MKKLIALAIIVTSVSAHSQDLDWKGALLGLGQEAIGRKAASDQTRQLRTSLSQVLDKLNDEANVPDRDSTGPWRLPAGATFAVEIDQNDSGEDDRKVIGFARSAIQTWAANARPALSFADREDLKNRNSGDRDNEELRNPTPKGLATRATWDVHVSVVRKVGYKDLRFGGSIFERSFFRLLGFAIDFDQSQELDFYELSLSFEESDTHEVPNGASFEVVGCDTAGYSVQFSAETNSLALGYSRSEANNLAQGLKDAFSRATKIYRNPPPSPKL